MQDVVIVGAGLAGLHCARLLARRGLRVVVIDRKASPADSVQTTGIFVRKTWQDFPMPEEQLGRPIREVVLYSPRRRPLRLTAPHDEFRVGRMRAIYMHLLEGCASAGAGWMPATRMLSCEPARGYSRLIVERSGRRETLVARFVIGADGARSLTARHLGLDRNRELLVGLEEVVACRSAEPALHCFLDPRLAPGYIAWVVADGEEAHIGVAGYRDRFVPAAALQEFRASVRHLADGPLLDRRGGLIPVGGMLRRIANPHGLLAGDATGAVSPLTAGGLDPALRLSILAAAVTAEWLGRGDPAVLREYSGDRFRARFLSRRWMRRLLQLSSRPALLELACAMLRTPPLRLVAEHVFFARGSFPDVDPSPVLRQAEFFARRAV